MVPVGVLRPITQTEDKHWDCTLDINARLILRYARLAVPLMEAQGWGRIVGITSFGSTRVFQEYGIVGVSKAAIDDIIRYLAVELAPKGINRTGSPIESLGRTRPINRGESYLP